MQITEDKIEVGTQVLFDGDGILFKILSTILGWVEPDYRKLNPKPWHVGVISRYDVGKGWMVLEATGKGVQENNLNLYDSRFYKLYNWFNYPVDPIKRNLFLSEHMFCPYDGLAYVWVTGAVLLSKVGINLGRWKNNSFMCWELLEEFDEEMGKPLCKENRTITIVDIWRQLTCA
jgi:hypothetical protein